MPRPALIVTRLLLLAFVITGILVLLLDAYTDRFGQIRPLQPFIFGMHMYLWMIFGMAANYFWDHYQAKKSWAELSWQGLFLPLIVSPLIFYGVWAMWKDRNITFVLNLVAFQNGFFWQVVFSKLKAQ